MIPAKTPLCECGWLPRKEIEHLISAGKSTPLDLLQHLPRRYEDRRRFDAFPLAAGGPPLCIRGTVLDTRNRFGSRTRFYEAVISDTSGHQVMGPSTVTCRWFNMPFLSKVLA
ncbi:MAG: hypothetical protein ACQKBU_03805, partial [Verrucomicrobiales bacterium]